MSRTCTFALIRCAERETLRGCTDTITSSCAGARTLVTGIEMAPLLSGNSPATARLPVASSGAVVVRDPRVDPGVLVVGGVVPGVVGVAVVEAVALVVVVSVPAVVVGRGRVGAVTGSEGAVTGNVGSVTVGSGRPSAAEPCGLAASK